MTCAEVANFQKVPLSYPELDLDTGNLDVVALVFTFNQETFIAECLRSILSQEFTGSMGVVIYDDCSTDATRDKIRECVAEFAHTDRKVWLIAAEENLWSKAESPFKRINNMISAKYIAFCDGDDAWGDPLKIQKQFDFMEANARYAVCGHDSKIVDETGALLAESKLPEGAKRDCSDAELRRLSCWVLMNTIFYRADVHLPESIVGRMGHYKYMPEVAPAIYRKHSNGVWSSKDGLSQLVTQSIADLRLAEHYLAQGDQETSLYLLLRTQHELNRVKVNQPQAVPRAS